MFSAIGFIALFIFIIAIAFGLACMMSKLLKETIICLVVILVCVIFIAIPIVIPEKTEAQTEKIQTIYITQEGKDTHDVVKITTSEGKYSDRYDVNEITIGEENTVRVKKPYGCWTEITSVEITKETAEKLGIIQIP